MRKKTHHQLPAIFILTLILLSGCTQQPTVHEITITELINNPEKYQDQKVKIQAYYVFKLEESNDQIIYTLSDEQNNVILAVLSRNINDSTLIKNKQYLWTGIVTILHNDNIQIHVTEITPLSNQTEL